MSNDLDKPQGTDVLLHSLRELIQGARQKALRAVDAVQVQTCWEIGRHIVEFEQGGASRAAYGTRLLPILAESLTREFGRGFDATNLRHMRVFYQAFPIRDALRPELSWTHIERFSKSRARRHGPGTWPKPLTRAGQPGRSKDRSTPSTMRGCLRPRTGRLLSISEKRQIVQLTMQAGASVAEVAREHGLNANQVFKWRRAFERGELTDDQPG